MDRLFYLADYSGPNHGIAESDLSGVEIWKPSWHKVFPRGVSFYPFFVFWLFHHLRVFANREYAVLLIHDGGRLVHRSTIIPRYFRSPFMQKGDVQIALWTAPDYRRRGLARLALKLALSVTRGRSGRLWYITKETNLPSRRVATACDLVLVGRGSRVSRLGSQVLGQFVLQACADPHADGDVQRAYQDVKCR